MKTASLLLPLLALAVVGCAERDPASNPTPVTSDATTPPPEPTLGQRVNTAGREVADRTREVAHDVSESVAAKMREWDITPEKVREELRQTGQVIRTNSKAVAERAGVVIDNARLVTLIKGKYASDSQLSARRINVDANQGVVTLHGTADSAEQIAKAVTLALDTEGVKQVVSNLRIASE